MVVIRPRLFTTPHDCSFFVKLPTVNNINLYSPTKHRRRHPQRWATRFRIGKPAHCQQLGMLLGNVYERRSAVRDSADRRALQHFQVIPSSHWHRRT